MKTMINNKISRSAKEERPRTTSRFVKAILSNLKVALVMILARSASVVDKIIAKIWTIRMVTSANKRNISV